MKLIKIILKIIENISNFCGNIASLLIPAMTLILLYEIILRYFFRSPTIWVFDTAIFMYGYCGFLAGANVLRKNSHINIDIIYHKLSTRGKAIIDVITAPLMIFFMVLVVIYGWSYAVSGIKQGACSNTEWGPPIGHYRLIIPIGAALVLLQAIANFIRNIYKIIMKREIEL